MQTTYTTPASALRSQFALFNQTITHSPIFFLDPSFFIHQLSIQILIVHTSRQRDQF